MYVSKTPLRISFFSGGDMRSFYSKEPGAVLSCTIDKYVYVIMNDHPTVDYNIRTMYDVTEDVSDLNEVKNDIIRETLKYYGLTSGFTIASMTDIPANGTGLGSSSAFAVGLAAACARATKQHIGPFQLAEIACEIEINKCLHPIGKQDQYAASLGGLNYMNFYADEQVTVARSLKASNQLFRLEKNLLLVYSGRSRSADDILHEQDSQLRNNQASFDALKRNAKRAEKAFQELQGGHLGVFGEMLHDAWEDKKKVAPGISNSHIDTIYDEAVLAGAYGGKLIGAGGGGFFIFYVPEHERADVINAVTSFSQVQVFPFQFVQEGCRVIEI